MKIALSFSKHDRFVRDLGSQLRGSTILVERREADWSLAFSNGFAVSVQTVWRLLDTTSICVTSEDDRQQFGLAAPMDAAEHANGLLSGKGVEKVKVDTRTGDLRIHVAGALLLEVLTTSSGYESWTMWRPNEPLNVSANGGLV